LEIRSWPEEDKFHPHGIYWHSKTNRLYVINHAYDAGGERVEVIITTQKKDTIKLKYERSFAFQDKLMGSMNDLVVVGNGNEFYITQWLPFPHDMYTMKDHSILAQLRTLYH
jgi:hypothetical protein